MGPIRKLADDRGIFLLEGLLKRCIKTCSDMARPFELILVDDGSNDASPRKIAQAAELSQGKVIGVLLTRNYGQHAAVMAGLRHLTAEGVITADETVACVLTGHPLKDPTLTVNYHKEKQGRFSNPPIEASNDLEEIIRLIQS